jgi:hypothetical protein
VTLYDVTLRAEKKSISWHGSLHRSSCRLEFLSMIETFINILRMKIGESVTLERRVGIQGNGYGIKLIHSPSKANKILF